MNRRNTRCFLIFLLHVLPVTALTQQKGIQFQQGLNWQQALAKAGTENKYIFMDVYATWCVPCKMMEKEVYANDTAGEYMNARFLSVKVQMDSSKNDDQEIKNWYRDAQLIGKQYGLRSYPTYLFFSPAGELVHRGSGYKDLQGFISMAGDAQNPEKQYVSLLKQYRQGQKDKTTMPYLAVTASQLSDSAEAANIAQEYITDYLAKLPESERYTQQHIAFLSGFTKSSINNGFQMLYRDAEIINRVMENPDYAQSAIHYIISKEEIDPALIVTMTSPEKSPKWNRLQSAILHKYNAYYAERTILDSKARWYGYKKNWTEFTKNIVTLVEKYGTNMSNWIVNGHAWNVFQYSDDQKELKAAAKWMKKVVTTEKDSTNLLPAALDTYANLLYKTGRKEEAATMEKKALEVATIYDISNFMEEFKKNLDNMVQGKPTWPAKPVQ